MKWEEDIVTVSGTMALTDNGEKGLFFQMKDASSTSMGVMKKSNSRAD